MNAQNFHHAGPPTIFLQYEVPYPQWPTGNIASAKRPRAANKAIAAAIALLQHKTEDSLAAAISDKLQTKPPPVVVALFPDDSDTQPFRELLKNGAESLAQGRRTNVKDSPKPTEEKLENDARADSSTLDIVDATANRLSVIYQGFATLYDRTLAIYSNVCLMRDCHPRVLVVLQPESVIEGQDHFISSISLVCDEIRNDEIGPAGRVVIFDFSNMENDPRRSVDSRTLNRSTGLQWAIFRVFSYTGFPHSCAGSVDRTDHSLPQEPSTEHPDPSIRKPTAEGSTSKQTFWSEDVKGFGGIFEDAKAFVEATSKNPEEGGSQDLVVLIRSDMLPNELTRQHCSACGAVCPAAGLIYRIMSEACSFASEHASGRIMSIFVGDSTASSPASGLATHVLALAKPHGISPSEITILEEIELATAVTPPATSPSDNHWRITAADIERHFNDVFRPEPGANSHILYFKKPLDLAPTLFTRESALASVRTSALSPSILMPSSRAMSLTSEPPVGTHLAGHRVPPPDSDFHLLPDTLRPEKRGQPDVDHAEGPTQKAARTNASSASIQPVSGGTFSTSQVNDLRDAAKRRRKRYMEGRQTTAPAVTQQVPLAERIRVLEGERRAEEDSRRAAEGAKDELRKKLHTLSQRVAEVDHCEKNADAEGRAWQAEGLALETKLSALRRESSAALKEHVAEFDQVAKGKGKKKQEWDAERFALEDKLAAVQQESSAVVEKRLTWFERTISSMQHDLSVALELRTELERAKVSSEKEKQAWQMEKLSLEDKLATLQRERRAGLEQHTAELDRVQKGKELLAQRVSELESAERRTDAERQTWKTERVALENTLAQRTSELERAVKTRDQEKVAWRAEKLALEASHAAVTQEKEVAQRAKEGLRQELLQAMEKNVQLFSAQAKDAAGILLRLQEQTRLDAGHQVSGSPDSTSPS